MNLNCNPTSDQFVDLLENFASLSLSAPGSNAFTFPADSSLSQADVGLLTMNDGSGTAKVYQLSDAVPPQLGVWTITLTDITTLGDASSITINSSTQNLTFTRVQWRGSSVPTTPTQELDLIQAYIAANYTPGYLSTVVNVTQLQINELLPTATYTFNISLSGWAFQALSTVQTSHPYLPPAPTAFPLGKLVALAGNTALISSQLSETFTLDGDYTFDSSIFNYSYPLVITDIQDVVNLIQLFVFPSSNGLVKPLIIDASLVNSGFQNMIRHHFIGMAISNSGRQVNVRNMTSTSALASIFIRLLTQGTLN